MCAVRVDQLSFAERVGRAPALKASRDALPFAFEIHVVDAIAGDRGLVDGGRHVEPAPSALAEQRQGEHHRRDRQSQRSALEEDGERLLAGRRVSGVRSRASSGGSEAIGGAGRSSGSGLIALIWSSRSVCITEPPKQWFGRSRRPIPRGRAHWQDRRRARYRRTRSARGLISSTPAASSLLRPSQARSSNSSRSLSLRLASACPSRVSPAVGERRPGRGGVHVRVHFQALAQRALTRAAAALVGQRAAGHAQEPDPLPPARNLLEPAPGDQEDLGEHVVGVRPRRTPSRVAQNRTGMGLIQRLETFVGRHRHVDVRLGPVC